MLWNLLYFIKENILSLIFVLQAIHCRLANIEPSGGVGNDWCPEATAVVEGFIETLHDPHSFAVSREGKF